MGQESLFDDADPELQSIIARGQRRSPSTGPKVTEKTPLAAQPDPAELIEIKPEEVRVEQVREAGP